MNVAICVFIFLQLKINAKNSAKKIKGLILDKRILEYTSPAPTCTSSDCSTCISSTTCYFLKSTCSQNSGSSMISESYTQSTEYQFCNNGVSSGSINLSSQPKASDQSQSITLYSLSSSHPLCEWNIQTDSSYQVTVNITRSSTNNYENIIISYTSVTNGKGSTSTTTMYNNQLSSCTSVNTTTDLVNVNSILIAAKIMDPSSNYQIIVSQKTQKVTTSSNYDTDQQVILASCILVMISIGCIFLTCIGYVCRSIQCFDKTSKAFRMKTGNIRADIPYSRIIDTMNCMISGKYGTLVADDFCPQCGICNKMFSVESNVHITNECTHIFHSSCLEDWFSITYVNCELTCPSCGTSALLNCSRKDTSGIVKAQIDNGLENDEDVNPMTPR